METEISSASNQLEVKIDFDADFEKGNQYIIFQYLYDKKGNLIASHQDINDEKQKLYCPAIDTYCYDKMDSDKFILPSQSVQIIDEIDFDALIKSEVYTLVSQLVDLSSNQIVATSSKEFLYDGQKVNAEISSAAPVAYASVQLSRVRTLDCHCHGIGFARGEINI